ncbi:MAG: HemK2/MTQ2 family protein methyltransferase [Candidatus Nanohaloarchaea archaeon]|nr:HemK2/MTQ2 family protein methyltransferase [Candidatus Nanohaloarchaea archaeon]
MPDVYRPRKDSYLLKEAVEQQELDGKHVLDMGTGSGIIAAAAVEHGAEVTAVDIDPDAVAHVRDRFSGEDRVSVVRSDLFDSVTGTFDIIAFNPPYVPSTEKEQESGQTWAGGEDGRDVVDGFLSAAADYLAPGGNILLLQSTRNDLETTRARFTAEGLEPSVVAREQLHFEELVVFEAVPTA